MPKNIIVGDSDQQYSDIQTAINDLPSEGGVVYIRPGQYIINASNLIRITNSNVSLIGSGAATLIKLDDNVSNQNNPRNIIKIGDGTNSLGNILISNLRIEGNKTNNTHFYGIVIEKGNSNIIIENCIIENCYFGGIHSKTIDGSDRCNYCIITNNIIKNSHYHGISLSGLDNSSIYGNSVYCTSSPVGHGIYIYYANNNSVFGNTAKGFINGISLQKCTGLSVNGNNIINNKNSGIMAQQGGYNAITGNVLYDNTLDSVNNDKNEIQLRANQGIAEKFDLVSGNVIFNQNVSSDFGIKEFTYAGSSNPDNNLIIGNNFHLYNSGSSYRVELITGNNSVNEYNEGN